MEADWFNAPGPTDVGFEGRCNARKGGRGAQERGTVGERCGLKAGYRTSHLGIGPCCFHGGASPKAVAKYERIRSGQLLHGYGLRREGDCDPRDLLMEELARTAGNVDYLELCLQDLTEDELLGKAPLPTELETGYQPPAGAGGGGGEYWKLRETVGVPVLVDLYRWERTHLAKLSSDAVKLGLLERAVRVEEAQATLVAAALGGALEAAGLEPAQLEAVKADLVVRLRELEAASAKPRGGLQARARRELEE